jgi:3-deoxy-D-manno-octulosonate 8-phosphate phosphatase (KDO 8-P phosphatase)
MGSSVAIEEHFSKLGASFVLSPAELGKRLRGVRGLVFDWDGVFNSGDKGESTTSTFAEADSMGTNLWRYALWRVHGELPVTAIVTGATNPTARQFAARERFSAIYFGVLDKGQALRAFCSEHGIEPGEVACVFDDVNDLPMAALCGVRFLVRRAASPLLLAHAIEHGLCDYVTGLTSGRNAVREVAELALGMMGEFDAVVASRVAFDDDYARYFSARQAVSTVVVPHQSS